MGKEVHLEGPKQLYTETQYILAKQPMGIILKREGYLEDLKANNNHYSW